jgi:Arc/MetJ-type ribon-helix-helix transcriptional regulator
VPIEERRNTVIVSFHIPPNLLKAVDELVEKGVFTTRSEAFRTAIVLMLRDYTKLQRYTPQPEVGYR